MGTSQVTTWTPEYAKSIEEALTTILTSIPGVTKSHGCSYDKYEDFKVVFDFVKKGGEVEGCFLKFNLKQPNFISPTRKPGLEAWTGGLSTYWPEEVKVAIKGFFPGCRYRQGSNNLIGVDPWHYWIDISLEELMQKATDLKKA